MSRRVLEGCYARLCGLRDTINNTCSTGHRLINVDFSNDYDNIIIRLRKNIDDKFLNFDLGECIFHYYNSAGSRYKKEVQSAPLLSKINQLIQYLEMVHRASNRIVEIGSVYNLIKDPELKSRCSDLLSAPDHFDRVINQATQVLEERIRQKVPEFVKDAGKTLVNKAMNADTSISKIKFSDDNSEQEGFVNLFRGMIGAFRNPSHHRFSENVSREQALQICAFIDNMLALLETAEISQI